jgi:hypothetical protein
MGICPHDFRFSPISRLMIWSDAIAPPKSRSRGAAGRWSGSSLKRAPLNRSQPAWGTALNRSARLPGVTTSTASRASRTAAIAILVIPGCYRPGNVRPSRPRSNDRLPTVDGERGRKSPPGWPPPWATQCIPSGPGRCSSTSAGGLTCHGRAMPKADPALRPPLKKASPTWPRRPRGATSHDVVELWTVDQHYLGLRPILRRI